VTGVIIQARLGSSRFPRKILADLDGQPMLGHVIRRAQAIVGIRRTVVAVPTEDLPTLKAAFAGERVLWWGGPGNDVLQRYWEAARHYALDPIVRVTADCPRLDPNACWRVLDEFRRRGWDYASNVDPSTDGLDCEVFSWQALDQAHHEATSPLDREHVTPWMRRSLRCGHVAEPPLPGKWSVDTPEDLARLQAVTV